MQHSYDREDIPRVIIEEHLALRTASRWLVGFLAEVPDGRAHQARRVALHEYLGSLKRELIRHFGHEENEEGFCQCHVGETAFHRLCREHVEMLAKIDALSIAIKTGEGPFTAPELQGFDDFLALLATHETEEREALEKHRRG